ncbi:YkvA family protein [Foetidibacter luteolus]|uniref:YkvA family protein n=1 Tax=Foetidibacter luteolus TaxID=2608880 RepID=UPI00129A2D0D|nr:YkvA family protein [Foetidibacter luteolus]
MPAYSFKRPLKNGVRLYGLIKNRKIVWQMMKDAFNGSYRFSFFTLAVLVLSLIYIFSPLDFLPDFIPFIGWIDDGVVIYFLSQRIVKEAERYLRLKAVG